jgi:hypothetical protein
MTNRKYLIFSVSEQDKIDWNQVLENRITIKSLDGTKSLFKWDTTNDPDFLGNLTNTAGPYTNSEILEILKGSEWTPEEEEEEDE